MPGSGFEWILGHLHADVRRTHCAQALQKELADVQTQLSACCKVVARAAQVAAGVASLEAQQTAVIRALPAADTLLSGLHTLQCDFRRQLDALLQPFAASDDRSAVQRKQWIQTQRALDSRLTGGACLADAVE